MEKFYLIDNNIFYLTSLESQLRASERRVFANHGDLGLAHAIKEILLNQPDIIVMDLIFPSFEGVSLMHSLQESDHTNNIPIAVYTTMTNRCLEEASLSKGAGHFFTKEKFPPHLLLDRLYKIYKD